MEMFDEQWPTRALQQEEEEEAQKTADLALAAPSIKWLKGSSAPVDTELLIVAASEASAVLLEQCCVERETLASIEPPAAAAVAPPTAGDGAAADGADAAGAPQVLRFERPAMLYRLTGGDATVAASLLCVAPTGAPPERAGAWASALLDALRPARVVVLGAVAPEHYRGDGDASQAFLAFLVQSSAARKALGGASATPPVPFLPSGSIAAGLPAALLAAAEARGVRADLLLVVDAVRALAADDAGALARAAAAVLRLRAGGGGSGAAAEAAAAQLGHAARVERAREALDEKLSPSSVYA